MSDCCSMSWHLHVTRLGMSQVPRWYWHTLLCAFPMSGVQQNRPLLKTRFWVKSHASLGDMNVFLVEPLELGEWLATSEIDLGEKLLILSSVIAFLPVDPFFTEVGPSGAACCCRHSSLPTRH